MRRTLVAVIGSSVGRGLWFEQCLETAHEMYKMQMRAYIEKTWPMMRFVGGERSVGRAVGQALPDYVGCVSGGRSLLVEAKTWQAKEMKTLRDRMHQAVRMQRWSRLNALCGYVVAWRWEGLLDVRWYPIEGLKIQSDRRGEYIVFCKDDGVPVRNFDWLSASTEALPQVLAEL